MGQSCWGTCAEDLPALILSSSEFVAPVSVPVQEVLDFICRTLSISAKNIVSDVCPPFPVLRPQGNQESSVGSEAPQTIPSLRCLSSTLLLSDCHYSLCSRHMHRVVSPLVRGHLWHMLQGEGKHGGQPDIAERQPSSPHSPSGLCFIGWGFDLVGRGGPGWVPYMCVHMYLVTHISASLSLCVSRPCSFCQFHSAELAWRWSPAVVAAAFYPPGSLGPALCAHPCVSGLGRV